MNQQMENLPFVSILVVNYNGLEHLPQFIESVTKLKYPKDRYELVIVDNGSTDNSVKYLKENYGNQDWIKIIELPENTGFARGNNIGINYCKGEYVALINNDVILDENWLIRLVMAAKKYPNSIIGSKMLWYHMKATRNLDVIIYGGGKILCWGWPMHLNLYKIDRDDSNDKNRIIETFYADGCGLLIPRKLFIKIGGFDSDYFAYAEDYELSWKARIMGYNVYYVPSAKFYHKISQTFGEFSEFRFYHLIRNHMWNIFKFCEMKTLIYMLSLFVLYVLAYGVLFLMFRQKKPRLVLSILRAIIDFMKSLPTVARKRAFFQHIRIIKDKELKKKNLFLSFGDSIREIILAYKRRMLIRS